MIHTLMHGFSALQRSSSICKARCSETPYPWPDLHPQITHLRQPMPDPERSRPAVTSATKLETLPSNQIISKISVGVNLEIFADKPTDDGRGEQPLQHHQYHLNNQESCDIKNR